jgi:hypothetical protein
MSNYLLDGMHAEPITAIDQRISPHMLSYERCIIVGLVWEIETADTTLRNDTAVVRLQTSQRRAVDLVLYTYTHDIVISLLLSRPDMAFSLQCVLFRRHFGHRCRTECRLMSIHLPGFE